MSEAPYIIVRPINPGDNPELAQLVVSVLTEFGCVGPGYASSDPELEHLYETYQEAGSAYFVVFDPIDERILGGGGFARLKGTTPEEGICELQKLYFYPEIRGKGFGRQILERCIKGATAAGYREMYLESTPQMESAVTMYRKCGFTSLPGQIGATGHTSCTVFMSRPLAPVQVPSA